MTKESLNCFSFDSGNPRFRGQKDLKAREAKNSNVVNANEGAFFYRLKSFTFRHKMAAANNSIAHKVAQDAFLTES
jgi:hypothetical protein